MTCFILAFKNFWEVFVLSICRKWTITFCLLSSASFVFGQIAKTMFKYALLTGWLLGGAFILLAIIMAIKAYEFERR